MNGCEATPGDRRLHRGSRHVLLRTLLVSTLAVACSPAGAGDSPGEYRGQAYMEPIPRPDFTLTDTEGQPYSFVERTEGQLSLLFFGYTQCPDVCPIHMANIGQVLRDMGVARRRRVTVVFVTTDPERDTAERIREWLDVFDASFVGLRGTIDEVNQIQIDLGLPPSVNADTDENGGYLVGHAASVIAFSPDGPARLRYPFGTRQADWAHDLPKLMDQPWVGP